MIRGMGDPLVALYAKCFLSRVSSLVYYIKYSETIIRTGEKLSFR